MKLAFKCGILYYTILCEISQRGQNSKKKLTLGILCLSLCAYLTLTSCQNKKDDTADNTTDDSSVSDLAGIVLPRDEEEDKVIYEYSYSGDGATLIAYNGVLEEVILDLTVIRMK